MLTAYNSITINKPSSEVWSFITKPNNKQSWWFTDGRYLSSNWQASNPIFIYYKDGTECSRGKIIQIEDSLSILFTMHDAYEEDTGYDDYFEEHWRITVISENNSTKVVVAISDYDSQHDTDDAHDHEETLEIWKDAQENFIPQALSSLKMVLESKQVS